MFMKQVFEIQLQKISTTYIKIHLFSSKRNFKSIILYKHINTIFIYSLRIIILSMFNNPQNQNIPNQIANPPQQSNQNSQAAQLGLANLTQYLQGVHQLQGQAQLQNLIIMLRFLQNQSMQSIDRVCLSREALLKNDSAYHLSNVNRFKAIKQKNQELLIRVLNLRQKMVSQMYMYKIRSPKQEIELDHLSEKIRHLRMRVNTKYTQLKYLKMSNQENQSKHKKQQYNYSPLSVPLNDLKKGAQIIERESIRLREELNILIRHLHGEQI